MASNLTQLRDIHQPDPIGWWPLAPGWYLLILVFVITCLLIGFFIHRYYFNGRAKREALRALVTYQKQYEEDENSQLLSARISEVLKRVALAYYPRTRVASLQGDAWIMFLNSTAKGVNFNSVRVQLLELPYRPSKSYPLQPLVNVARKWIIKQGKPCSN